ncbi:microfibril-associated glycoprotein 4-like [Engraulis encrasicolus]|uniref:microfibril-associated glycoprotein 4-like n=1 Tax=Engraulis encrasicolus TaxID=184585 RepID=UPI002FCF67E5
MFLVGQICAKPLINTPKQGPSSPHIHISTLLESMSAQLLLLLLLPVLALTAHADHFLPLDCAAIQSRNNSNPSGVYAIYPVGPLAPLRVYCDMESGGGGWTVFQRRLDGSVSFLRPYDAYRAGFGSVEGELWLGLDNLLLLTRRAQNELRVDMEDWEGNRAHAHYAGFSLGSEEAGYALELGSFVEGDAGDSLKNHNGAKFSTFDKDQDVWDKNCAGQYLGGFWYTACHSTNPNGLYVGPPPATLAHRSVYSSWGAWKTNQFSLKSISMKIRPVSHCSHVVDV